MGKLLYPLSTPLFPLSSHHVLLKNLFILRKSCKVYIFFEYKVTKTKRNTKIKQQDIKFDQLYIDSEVSFKHIATSRLVHVQLSNTFKIK